MKSFFTLDEASQNLVIVLEQAEQSGEVRIVSPGGKVFVIRPELTQRSSAMDVAGVDTGVTAEEILEAIKEGRRRGNLTDGEP
jgi:hypothetical protein